MSGNVVRVDSDYKVQVAQGGHIVLDTRGTGEVKILGDLKVIGVTTSIQTTNTNISNNLFTINKGETGYGIGTKKAGIEIDRGTHYSGNAQFVFDEEINWQDPFSATLKYGLFVFKTADGRINGIRTNAINTNGENLNLINFGNGVISVTGTNHYETHVTDDDHIPNKKYLVDFVQSSPTIYDAINTTSETFNLIDENATTVNFARAATTLNMGATSGTTTIRNPTLVGSQTTQNLYNTVATTMNFAQAATALNMGADSGTITIGNPTLVGTQTTQNVYNTIASTVNAFGYASTISIGASVGILTLNSDTITGSNTTQNLFNTVATTVNFAQNATTVSIGKTTGSFEIRNPILKGFNLTQDVFSTVATTINFAGAATTISIGAPTGTTTFNSTTPSTSPITGSVVFKGGVGISGDLNSGGVTNLLFQGSDPAADPAGVKIYSKNSDLGVTGIYFINSTVQGELVSKAKALAYSIVFG